MPLYIIRGTLLSRDCPTDGAPYKVLDIPEEAEEIVIPDGITHIDDYAFFGRSSLRSVVIPASVTHFGTSSFGFCSSLYALSLHPHHLDHPELEGLLNNCTRLHCVLPIGYIPEIMRLDACCGFAKFRSSYPPEMQSDYLDYLRQLTAHIFEDTDEYFPIVLSDEEYLFDTAFDTPELLSLLCSERLLGDAASSAFLQEAQLRDDLSACALLLDYRCTLNNADKLHLDSL